MIDWSRLQQVKYLFFWFMICCPVLQAAWLPPEEVSQSSLYLNAADVAVSSDGNAFAVWRSSSENVIVQAAIKPKGGSWGSTTTLSGSFESLLFPRVAVDPLGNAIALWAGYDGSSWIIQSSVSQHDSGIWSTPVDIFSGSDSLLASQLVIDAAGNATAVWVRYDGSEYYVESATKLVGSDTWQSDDSFSSSELISELQLTADADGTVIAVWEAGEEEDRRIRSSEKPQGGIWSSPSTISTSGQLAYAPQTAADAFGNTTAVWIYAPEGENKMIQAATKPNGATWGSVENITDPSENVHGENCIAADPAGNLFVAWVAFESETFYARSSKRLFGGSWQPPVQISALGGQVGDVLLEIIADAAGNATVAWQEFTFSEGLVKAATHPFGGSWQSVATLSNPGAFSGAPQLAVDGAGTVIAVWSSSSDEEEYSIESATKMPLPLIFLLAPNSGPPAGGTTVVITGENFTSVLTVLFGTVPAASLTVDSPTSIRAVAPPGAAGTVDVRVMTSEGISFITPNGRYTYQSQEPKPPCAFKGKLHKRDHYHKHRYRLKTTWKKSPTEGVAFYRIYKRSHLVKTVAAHKKRAYSTHLRWRSSTKKFRITAVTENNVESARKKLKVKH